MDINKTRKIYKNKKPFFDEYTSPFLLFKKWYIEATKKVSEPNAFALSTSYQGKSSSRMMLLKSFSNSFTFYTNISSRKGRDIKKNNQASMLFWWKELQRQVRIEGNLYQLSESTVRKYFYSRPKESQIGALISNQSSEVSSFTDLIEDYNKKRIIYKNKKVPFPKNWTGFQLKPRLIEFWQGGENRLHQRVEHKRNGKKWDSKVLAP